MTCRTKAPMRKLRQREARRGILADAVHSEPVNSPMSGLHLRGCPA